MPANSESQQLTGIISHFPRKHRNHLKYLNVFSSCSASRAGVIKDTICTVEPVRWKGAEPSCIPPGSPVLLPGGPG